MAVADWLVAEGALSRLNEVRHSAINTHRTAAISSVSPQTLNPGSICAAWDMRCVHRAVNRTNADIVDLKCEEEGYCHGVAWLLRRPHLRSSHKTSSTQLATADRFLKASTEIELFRSFINSARQGMCELRWRDTPPTVAFSMAHNTKANALIGGLHESHNQGAARLMQVLLANREQLQVSAPKLLSAFYLTADRHWQTRDPYLFCKMSLEDLSKGLVSGHMDDIGAHESLGDFTVAHLDAVFGGLKIWSWGAFQCAGEHLARGGPLTAPSQSVRKDVVVDVLSRWSGLDRPSISAVIDAVTLDLSLEHTDAMLQPLLALDGHRLTWSTAAVMNSRHRRNMLKILMRSGGARKQIADNLVGRREIGLANWLRDRFAMAGYNSHLFLKLPRDLGEVDVLVTSREDERRLLLIEVKGALDPDDVDEVARIGEHYQKAQSQLANICDFLRNANIGNDWLKRRTGVDLKDIDEILTLVVFSDAGPDLGLLDPSCPFIDKDQLEVAVKWQADTRLSDILQVATRRPWLGCDFQHINDEYGVINIGGLEVRFPVSEVLPRE